MEYQLSISSHHQHHQQNAISSNMQSTNLQILPSVVQHHQSHNLISTSLPLPPLNSLPIQVSQHLPQILNNVNGGNNSNASSHSTLLHLNNGNSENLSSHNSLHQHLQNELNQNENNTISSNELGHNNNETSPVIDSNNNCCENNRWTQMQVQQFWKHNIQCKCKGKGKVNPQSIYKYFKVFLYVIY